MCLLNGVHWWKTPAESPDANPIENRWNELKEYMRREVEPHNKDKLVNGIAEFWKTVDQAKCKKYLRKVLQNWKVLLQVIDMYF